MRKKPRQKTIRSDGVCYFADNPSDCRQCFFWKNRKVGCIFDKELASEKILFCSKKIKLLVTI